jgi:hypothetical protein
MKRHRTTLAVTSIAALIAIAVPREAAAQLHWDASAHVGAMKRVLANRPAGGDDASVGPTAQLMAHVALLPLVHVGGYFGHDISSVSDVTRNTTFGGLRVKGLIPVVPKPFRLWFFAGFGYAGVYQQSLNKIFSRPDPLGGGTLELRAGRIEGAGGSFFEVPLGFGASYRFRKPWELSAELGARLGFGHTGSVYEPPGPQVTIPNNAGQNALPAGLDRFALGLTVGISMDL